MADPALDHYELADLAATRRYFRKFGAITGHLGRVAGLMEAEGRFTRDEIDGIARYLVALTNTFRALGHKYHLSGRFPRASKVTLDRVESGFPVLAELLLMANDMAQAELHLRQSPGVEELKDQMVRQIVGERQIPTRLQFTLSQRLYHEELAKGALFLARNDPEPAWLGADSVDGRERRRFLLRWAVYDGQVNLPAIYLMEVEDTGWHSLPRDQSRWPAVQAHLMAQSLDGLKLLTIARGFDEDFADLHPTRLRRIHVGPMYSRSFTAQTGPIHDVLDQARAPEGDDWALAWTEEDLRAAGAERVRSGWFGSVERQVYTLDPFSARGAETGASATTRSVVMPQRIYQALAALDPPGFRDVAKFAVAPSGAVARYR
ncbi:hypothetical protein [Wenxinia saemankumensis]|uniref:Uncharacterized protein n=1 Tax=Wenxinia saemankumensis TaxID=1447782 RepID=A0A1M6C1W9_9RHOB|nr:hypothetical protein [Wenxinia saemankumensis]SHI54744.1 hypothetical protein SAMN05444417_0952 [Wenxinia saemankumensis]